MLIALLVDAGNLAELLQEAVATQAGWLYMHLNNIGLPRLQSCVRVYGYSADNCVCIDVDSHCLAGIAAGSLPGSVDDLHDSGPLLPHTAEGRCGFSVAATT